MKLIILGAGAFANTVADIAQQLGSFENIFFLDDNIIGDDIIGKCSDFEKYIKSDFVFFPAIGNNETRLKWFNLLEQNGAEIISLVHKSAFVSPTSVIGKGTIVLPNATINTNCQVKNSCIINCGAIIDHDCIIEDGVHICLGAIVKGENRIPCCNKIEAGEIVQRNIFNK